MELQTVCAEARAAGGYAMIDDSAERRRVDVLSRAMERISAAPHGRRGEAFEEAAMVSGVSAKRLHNLYTTWKRAKTDDERILALADGREYTEDGQVEYVDNASDDQTDTIQVFALFPNKNRILKPGGTVSVTLQSRKGVKKISIPPSAVMQDMHGSCVWVVKKDRTVERRYVVRDVTEGDVQFVASGLKVGETVVADGVHKVNKRSVIEPVK